MKFQFARRPSGSTRGLRQAATWWLLPFAVLVSSPALAQTAAIAGSITDRDGVVVPRALEATDSATQSVYSTLANDQGRYSLTGLPPVREYICDENNRDPQHMGHK